MNDADDLARRYLALWTEYLTALVADPQAAEMLQRWIAFASQFTNASGQSASERAGSPFAAWPPTPAEARASAGNGARPHRPQAAAAPIAGTSGERSDAVDELARRVGELEHRLAALEHQRERRPAPRRARRGGRASGK